MKRDLQKAINDYKKKYYHKPTVAGQFYINDIVQIRDVSGGSQPYYTNDYLFLAIENSLKAGYMIGYRTAKREARKK